MRRGRVAERVACCSHQLHASSPRQVTNEQHITRLAAEAASLQGAAAAERSGAVSALGRTVGMVLQYKRLMRQVYERELKRRTFAAWTRFVGEVRVRCGRTPGGVAA